MAYEAMFATVTHQDSNPGARTFSWIYFGIFRHYALSGKRRSRRRRCAGDDFGNLLIWVVFAYVCSQGSVCVRVVNICVVVCNSKKTKKTKKRSSLLQVP
jgi:hypothetical protein